MYFPKRYTFTERNENGKLIGTGEYSTVAEFDRHVALYPPVKGHTLTLCDSYAPLDIFGLCYEVVRKITGD